MFVVNRVDTFCVPASNTIILNLNDDCLQEIFKHLNLTDLCAVADVCHRFRGNARSYFASPKIKNDVLHMFFESGNEGLFLRPRFNFTYLIDENRVINYKNDLASQKFIHISKVLRNFGMLIKSIKIFGRNPRRATARSHEIQCKFEKNLFDLLSLHCSGGTLIELDLNRCDITGETENTLQPLLLHLRRLSLHRNIHSELFARMLSVWSPELRELHFQEIKYDNGIGVMHLDDILRQSFPKLEVFSLRLIPNIINRDIEEFLKRNRQLRKFGMENCRKIDGSIFQSMVTHVPDIEAIRIDRVSTIDDINLKYICKLNCLNTLKLSTFSFTGESGNRVNNGFMPSILYEIHVANFPLQHLHIDTGFGNEEFHGTEQLIVAISKLKTLKTLWLFFIPNLKVSHIHRICKQLTQLSELDLRRNFVMMTADDLLKIIKYAPKLQSFHCLDTYHFFRRDEYRHLYEPIEVPKCIDAYMKMVEIVGQRRERIRLLIALTEENPFIANLPKDLTRKFKDALTLVAHDGRMSRPNFGL